MAGPGEEFCIAPAPPASVLRRNKKKASAGTLQAKALLHSTAGLRHPGPGLSAAAYSAPEEQIELTVSQQHIHPLVQG